LKNTVLKIILISLAAIWFSLWFVLGNRPVKKHSVTTQRQILLEMVDVDNKIVDSQRDQLNIIRDLQVQIDDLELRVERLER
jgi:hypothetical protein